MSTAAAIRRLRALEWEEWHRVMAMPARDAYAAGYLSLDPLPPHERAELRELLERSFDDAGHIDRTRLTPEQQARGGALLHKLSGLIAERDRTP